MPYVDFWEVRRRVAVQTVLQKLKLNYRTKTNGRAYGPCPLQCQPAPLTDRKSRRCCSYVLFAGHWYCHKCKTGGNHLDLYAKVKGLTVYHAALELCEIEGVDVPLLDRPWPRREK